jgi:beta-glucosidase/6-phospho-beta-glucosidase/beta-galactosidase
MKIIFFILTLIFHNWTAFAKDPLLNSSNIKEYKFSNDFKFGIATAPSHVEDQFDDVWLDWAKAGKVKAFYNQVKPEDRIKFWSQPEVEIEYSAKLGIQIFRLGIDWGRFYDTEISLKDHPDFLNYKKIIKLIKANNMKVMLTLFHHTLPKKALIKGGWVHSDTAAEFVKWSLEVVALLKDDIDYLITFNEPNIFNALTYSIGVWPNAGFAEGFWAFLNLGVYKGNYIKAESNMIKAHQKLFTEVKRISNNIQVGIAQHFAFFLNSDLQKDFKTRWLYHFFNERFLDLTKNENDFIGVNYYGAEVINLWGGILKKDIEYSEAGRAIYPTGLYEVLKNNFTKYQRPQIITENGIADSTDWIRPAYLTEHLAVVTKAVADKIPIEGYIFWTLSDNWEWSDGYCPKFGLLHVDRLDDFKRTPRSSFFKLKNIIEKKGFTDFERNSNWNEYLSKKGQERPFCRHENGVEGLDQPIKIKLLANDWRFPY